MVPRVHSHSQEAARAASFVHQNRFAELLGDDTVSVLPQGSFVPQGEKRWSASLTAEESPQ